MARIRAHPDFEQRVHEDNCGETDLPGRTAQRVGIETQSDPQRQSREAPDETLLPQIAAHQPGEHIQERSARQKHERAVHHQRMDVLEVLRPREDRA